MTIIIVGIIYFLPTFIALMSSKRNIGAILFTNVFFGWTVLGWGLAMIWALTKDNNPSVHVE